MSKWTKTIGSLLLLMLVTGCGSNGMKEEEQNDNTLVYGSGEITSINPVLYEHGEINSLLFRGLMKNGEGNRLEKDLVSDYSISEDQKVYDFTLREDVLWHDGERFTAEDVKFTLEAIMDPENESEIASNYEEIEEIIVEDDNHVRILLKEPNTAMLEYITIGMVPSHLLTGKDLVSDPFNHQPIGTGPYKVESFNLGESVVLTANEAYYNGTPDIERIIFKFTPDSKTRALLLMAGELNLALVSPEDAETFKDAEEFTTYQMITADYRGILYNFGSDFFNEHRELPTILSYGVDREIMVESVLLGHGEPAYSPLQRSAYVKEDMERFDYNPQKVKEGLDNAGWTLGDDGVYAKGDEKLSFTIHCMEGDTTRVQLAQVASQQFKELGIDMKVEVTANIDWENQEAFLIGWGSPFDPDDHTYKVFGTDKGSNYSGYANAAVDEALKRGRETAVEAERRIHYDAFQEELTKDMPYTFLAYVDAIYVASHRLEGIDSKAVLGHHGLGLFQNAEDWHWNLGEGK